MNGVYQIEVKNYRGQTILTTTVLPDALPAALDLLKATVIAAATPNAPPGYSPIEIKIQ